MGTGYKLSQGLLFDKRWEGGMRMLSPKKFHKLFWELYDYQISGGEKKPPQYEDDPYIRCIASFIVPQIKNRLDGARRGGVPPAVPTAPPAGAVPAPHKWSGVDLSGVERSVSEDQPALTSAKGESAVTDGPATAEAAGHTHTEEKEMEKQAYGCHGNVLLTPAQYKKLTETLGISKEYIDRFSERLMAGRYNIPDHARAMAQWWANDREKYSLSDDHPPRGADAPQPLPTSFDVDDFFDAAVRASMGDDAEV